MRLVTSTAKRKVIIEIDPSAPVLTLIGDTEMDHEAGSEFIDPGATVADTAVMSWINLKLQSAQLLKVP